MQSCASVKVDTTERDSTSVMMMVNKTRTHGYVGENVKCVDKRMMNLLFVAIMQITYYPLVTFCAFTKLYLCLSG